MKLSANMIWKIVALLRHMISLMTLVIYKPFLLTLIQLFNRRQQAFSVDKDTVSSIKYLRMVEVLFLHV